MICFEIRLTQIRLPNISDHILRLRQGTEYFEKQYPNCISNIPDIMANRRRNQSDCETAMLIRCCQIALRSKEHVSHTEKNCMQFFLPFIKK